MSNRPPPFKGYAAVADDDRWAKVLSGKLAPHVYSSEAHGDFEPVAITSAEFFSADESGKAGGEPDPVLKPYQVMWRDRDRRRPAATRRAIPVPHWVYVVDPVDAERKPHSKVGRKSSYDWPAVERAATDLMDENGDFTPEDPDWNAQARLEKILMEQFGMSEATLRDRLPPILKRWREAKVGN